MKIRNIKDLREKKNQLKADIAEIESILKFDNPRKSLEMMTDGVTEKYLGGILNSKIGYKFLPIVGDFMKSSLKLGSAKLLNNMIKKRVTPSVVGKGIIGLGILIATPIILKKAKRAIGNYRRRETTKSLSKLI